MATVEKLIEARPIIAQPYRLNPSCGNCGKEATHYVLLENDQIVINQKLCPDCLKSLN